MVILNLYRITFHAVVVLVPEHDFLFTSTSTYCVLIMRNITLYSVDTHLPTLLCFNFFVRNFVIETNGSRILEKFCRNSEAIWSLPSEFLPFSAETTMQGI